MKMKKMFGSVALIVMILVGCSSGATKEEKKADVNETENSEMVIYLTRHGKTMLNTVDRSQGWIDAPLTPAGIEVTEQLGKGLSDVAFDKVVTSDSGRAIETAELVLKNNGQEKLIKEMTKDKRLREYNFGTYEGLMNSEMVAETLKEKGQTPEEYADWKESVSYYTVITEFADILSSLDKQKEEAKINWPAEDSETIIARLKASLDDITKEAEKEGKHTILVVSHGMSIGTLLTQLDTNADLPSKGVKNASVSKIIYKDGKYTVNTINDLSYIEKGKEMK